MQVSNTGTATFYPTLAGWWHAGVWQGTNGADGGGNYTSPSGSVIISKNAAAGGTYRDAYLLFNLSSPAFAGDTINSATLTFNAAALNQTGPAAIGIYGVSNTSWGATTADPSPAPGYPGATLIGTTQNVGGAQGSYASYTYSLAGYITSSTSGLVAFELNSPSGVAQETGFEVDNALSTAGVDPVITVNYTVAQPAWLGNGSQATWNAATKVLTVTGPTTIIADPGTDQPIIQANGSSAVVTINPASGTQIHIGGLSLANGASAIVTSLGSARTATNHRVLVLGQSGATSAPLLSIDSTSKLDLADNDLVDHDGSLLAVSTLLKTGFNEGAGYWNGNGIASSNAAAGKLYMLGDAQVTAAGTVDGETVSTADVGVKYVYSGDANLDGRVDGSDYSKIDAGYTSTSAKSGWSNGDFNYDGVIDGSDYALIDNAFNNQGAALATSSALVAKVAVQTSAAAVPTVAIPASIEATLVSPRQIPVAEFFGTAKIVAAARVKMPNRPLDPEPVSSTTTPTVTAKFAGTAVFGNQLLVAKHTAAAKVVSDAVNSLFDASPLS